MSSSTRSRSSPCGITSLSLVIGSTLPTAIATLTVLSAASAISSSSLKETGIIRSKVSSFLSVRVPV